jgi:hypothetical protein
MATYSRREVHTTRVEFLVPAAWPEGACWVEVQKAISAAIQELQANGLLGQDETPSDNQIRIRPGDEDVVVYFETSQALTDRGGS